MKLLPDRANSTPSGLLFFEFAFEQILKFVKFLSACFPFADVQPVENVLFLEDIGLEHFVENLGIFCVDTFCWDGVKNIITLIVVLCIVELMLLEGDPFCIVDEKTLIIYGHELKIEIEILISNYILKLCRISVGFPFSSDDSIFYAEICSFLASFPWSLFAFLPLSFTFWALLADQMAGMHCQKRVFRPGDGNFLRIRRKEGWERRSDRIAVKVWTW